MIDAPAGRNTVEEYRRNETRFGMVEKIDPARFRQLARAAQEQAAQRVALYEQLSHITIPRAAHTPRVPATAHAAEVGE